MLASSADGAGPSMVCGKASIREELTSSRITKRNWMHIQNTGKEQVEDIKERVKTLHAELTKLEEKAAAKKAQFIPTVFSLEQSTELVKSALKFSSVAIAKEKECGYARPGVSSIERKTIYAPQWDASLEAFETLADEKIGEGKLDFDDMVFMEACKELIGEGTACEDLCQEFSDYAYGIEVEDDAALGGQTYDELVRLAEAKRAEWKRAEKEQKECEDSVETISGLVIQFNGASDQQKKQRRSCGRAVRDLRAQEVELDELTIDFNNNKTATEDAQQAYKTAVANLATAKKNEAAAEAQEADALYMKTMAEDTLRLWQKHMEELKLKIVEQAKKVRKTQEAVSRADAASAAVSDFKDKLSTALVGLVRYYDEAVRLPLRDMGIREEVEIEALFPSPEETNAAQNLISSIDGTKDFCKERRKHFEQLADIEEESGTKLTAICDSQNWDAVPGEIRSVVDAKQTRAISNLKIAQQKVVSYAGPLADKATGEVEGVWKAMALFGDTDFSKNYLSGWRFAKDGTSKGSKEGFMMELASALKKAREEAVKLWEEAKEAARKLQEEMENTVATITECEKFLKDMIEEYDAAVENTKKRKEETAEARKEEEEKKKKKEDAEAALEKVRIQKQSVEEAIKKTNVRVDGLTAALAKANADLEASHETALSSFMELLHASEHQENESWD